MATEPIAELPPQPPRALRLIRRVVWLLVLLMVALTALLVWPVAAPRLKAMLPTSAPRAAAALPGVSNHSPTPSPTATPDPSDTPAPASLSDVLPEGVLPSTPGSERIQPAPFTPLDQGLLILSIREAGHSHLFAYKPPSLPLTRLTGGAWDDITPALSPDGTQLAFASNRDGYYDLYLMDLSTGEAERLTVSPEWEASPTWSPDGLWLAFERYSEDGRGLGVYIAPVSGEEAPVELINGPGAEHSPAWSPQGRRIAYVSTEDGDSDVWLADLDLSDGRFTNLSRNLGSTDAHPAWSPDGLRLAWSSRGGDGVQGIYLWNSLDPGTRPYLVGGGEWPAWSPDGTMLLTSLSTPNSHYLTGYQLAQAGLALPPVGLPGAVEGLLWGNLSLPEPLPAAMAQAAVAQPAPLWSPALTPAPDLPAGRMLVVPLPTDVIAPNPQLQDLVDESFLALRSRIAQEAGWEFLSSLENAFVPLTAPLGPGMAEDWLYTGRAFSFNTAPLPAGWLVMVREDFGSQVYWRVYLRARFQDGSQGRPLHEPTWNLNARFSTDSRAYEQGGMLDPAIPTGYWYDFTDLALSYGWQRLPALITWRSSYSGARFNEYVYRDNLDWLAAMREVYPREALNTPTPIPPPTDTPTVTPWPTRTPYMSPTPRPTRTLRPTTTPVPTRTPRPTSTPSS